MLACSSSHELLNSLKCFRGSLVPSWMDTWLFFPTFRAFQRKVTEPALNDSRSPSAQKYLTDLTLSSTQTLVQFTKPSLTKTNYGSPERFWHVDWMFWALLLFVRFSFLFCLLDIISFWTLMVAARSLHILNWQKDAKKKVPIKTYSTGRGGYV